VRSRPTQGHCWCSFSMWPPAMRCTLSRRAWPGGCSTSTIELMATSYRWRRMRFRSCSGYDERQWR